jgi:primosomal protein N'
MPTDEDGHFGRQCPSCSQIWRMHAEDYEALPDDRLWCVYCGHEDDHSEFITQQQLDRAMRAVGDIGVQLVQDALDRAFRPLARSSRSSMVSIQYRSKPFYPAPLPGIS